MFHPDPIQLPEESESLRREVRKFIEENRTLTGRSPVGLGDEHGAEYCWQARLGKRVAAQVASEGTDALWAYIATRS